MFCLIRKLVACFVVAIIFEWEGISTAAEPEETVVFVVHGTYSADSEWVMPKTDYYTFASELQRGFQEQCNIVPFLWKTDVRHGSRVLGAKLLADRLSDAKYDGKRVVIVAHSHGGNVALESLNYTTRFVDLVICLATPHVYLEVKDGDNRMSLPVYCSPKARTQIAKIISLTPRGDPVVGVFADLRLGMDDRTGVAWTQEWQEFARHPRLIDDGGPIQNLLEDWFSITISRNLSVRGDLNVGDVNIVLPCEMSDWEVHDSIHSCRMGFVLGRCIHDGITTEIETDLNSLVLAAGAGNGSPISIRAYGPWWNAHIDDFQFSGWILNEVKATSQPRTKPTQNSGVFAEWDVDRTSPDMILQIHSRSSSRVLHCSTPVVDEDVAILRPLVHVPASEPVDFQVLDDDLFGFHDRMTSFERSGSTEPPPTHSSPQVSLEMKWKEAHY